MLTTPILLGTNKCSLIQDLNGLEEVLDRQYIIRELELSSDRLHSHSELLVKVAAACCGDISFVSVQGSPLTLSVEPRQSLCIVALPSAGWGRYQLDSCFVENTAGQTIAFLPPRSWRLVNDETGGTAVQFTLNALIERIRAMSGGNFDLVSAHALFSKPFAVSTDCSRTSYYYHHLLWALKLLDSSYRDGFGEPDPRLGIDDLILRCIALLFAPLMVEVGQPQGSSRSLSAAVGELMDWMRENLQLPITLSDLELRSKYGRRALQLGFKQQVGCGPMQWLRQQRLESAFHQLLNQQVKPSIGQVAQSCGYLNLSTFSRDFRERFGLTASQVMRGVSVSLLQKSEP